MYYKNISFLTEFTPDFLIFSVNSVATFAYLVPSDAEIHESNNRSDSNPNSSNIFLGKSGGKVACLDLVFKKESNTPLLSSLSSFSNSVTVASASPLALCLSLILIPCDAHNFPKL